MKSNQIDDLEGLIELATRPDGTVDLETLGQNVIKYVTEYEGKS